MLKIRLQRVGRKHEPVFRVVVTESKNSTKSGRFHEIVGSYDPRTNKPELNAERIKHWLAQGVQVTGTVNNLLVDAKILTGKKINVLSKKHPPKKEEQAAVVAEAPKTETPAVEAEAVEEAPKEAAVEETKEAPAAA